MSSPVDDAGSEQDYPGRRRGMPRTGPGAVAGWGRRLVAIAIDWVLSMLVASVFIGQDVWTGEGGGSWITLAVFFAEASVLTGLLGGSAGQLILGIVIRRTSGEPLDLLRATLRSFLVCLVIPPLIFNREQQGLHDLAVDSIAIRR